MEDESTFDGPDARAPAPLTSGTEISGRYTLGPLLGAGGFGEVYRAEDKVLRRTVAVKILRPKSVLVWNDPAFGAFLAEARTIARLDHPHIVPVHDAGVHEGRPWIAMRLVEGMSLAELLRRDQKMDVPRAIRLLLSIASALGHAHRRGVVHRDVKPSNILIERLESGEERAWLLDFGVARVVAGDSTWDERSIAGTPAYLAPERLLGKPADGRSDLFSLACVAVETISGERAFDGKSVSDVVSQIVMGTPRGLDAVRRLGGASLAAAVEQALAKSPDDRPQDAETFIAELRGRRRRAPALLQRVLGRWRTGSSWAGTNTLEITELSKRYSRRSPVLKDLSLSVERGVTYVLLGRNGTGKSTLIRTFLGMYRPDRGDIRVFGRDPRTRREAVLARVGYVPTQLAAYERLRVRELLGLVSRFHQAWDPAFALHLISRFSLPLESRVRDLSHGLRTKVSLLAALSHRPEFLVLDDPTVGLDVVVISEFFATLREISRKEGTTIFLATHHVAEAEPLATHAGFLAGGRIAVSGRVDKLLERSARVQAVFSEDPPQQLGDVGLTEVVTSGRRVTGVATTDAPAAAERLRARGAVTVECRPLTLRELFVACTS